MSYGFEIFKDADGLRLGEVHESALKHIPDGKFAVSGHHATPGTSPVTTMSVTLTSPTGEYVASATASYVKS